MLIMVDLDKLEDSPFQARQEYAGIRELAVDIARNGMQQTPNARDIGSGKYQLIFGHRRLRAHRLLASEGVPELDIIADQVKWGKMMVNVVDADDFTSFDLGLSENINRHDLNIIEVAAAMRRYLEFGKTSVETGQKFGVSDATVRGKVRLLGLPAGVKEKIASGEITESAARKLLTLQRVAKDKVEAVATRLAESNGTLDPDQVIAGLLTENRATAVLMWEAWRSREEAQAGTDLWPLAMPAEEFPNQYLPEMDRKKAAEAIGIDLKNVIGFGEYWWALLHPENFTTLSEGLTHTLGVREPLDLSRPIDAQLIAQGAPESVIEFLSILAHPPSCSQCPFYVRMDKAHYCTFKYCFDRKKAAWARQAAEQASEKYHAPVYNPAKDGKVKMVLETWGDSKKADKYLDKDNPDVRILPAAGVPGYQSPSGANTKVIVVGKTAEKILAKEKKEKENDRSQRDTQMYDWEVRRRKSDAADQFIWEVASPIFGEKLLASISGDFLTIMADQFGAWRKEIETVSAKDKPAYYRRQVMTAILVRRKPSGWDLRDTPPIQTIAVHFQGLAQTWGVTLPADWLDLATRHEYGVSTETAETEVEDRLSDEAIVEKVSDFEVVEDSKND